MQRFRLVLKRQFQTFVIVGLLFLSTSAFAQKNILSSNQVWIQSYHEARVSSDWVVLLDGGFRWRDGFDDKLAYIVRAGLGYHLSPNLRVSAGFAHLGVYGGEKVVRYEYRPHQEFLLKDKLGRISISHRFRLEERFFKDVALDPVTTEFNFRFRYAVMLGIPLVNLSSKDPDRKLVLNIGDEIFLNAGKETSHRIFDQNRLIISPTLYWDKDLSVALTYNSQFASTPAVDAFLQSHIIWLQIRYNLEFSGVSKER